MKEWIVIDLDGTLFDCSHRIDFAKSKQWDDFHSRLEADLVFEDVWRLIHAGAFKVMALTGRTETYRQQTLTKFINHNIAVDWLLMRPNDDFRSDVEVKLGLLEQFFGSKSKTLEQVVFALDDRDRVVEGFRNYGLSCWQVRTGEY